MPLISIVIPSRNRALIVADTVRHTLSLTFKDIEVVVIDNDETSATSHALSQITDKRLRVVRTGGLAMPENWEEGFKAASGEYIYMQSDRLQLETDVLEYIGSRLEQYEPDVVKCTQGFPVEEMNRLQYADDWAVIDSDDVIKFILNSDIQGMYNFIPNGCSTFYSKKLVRSIQKRYGRMAARVTPDFTAAYLALFSTKEIHHTKRHAFVQVSKLSTGTSFQYGGNLGLSTLRHIGITVDEMVKDAKIPVTTIPLNTVFSDFFAISKMMGQRYTHEDMDDINHAIFLFRQLMQSKYSFHIDVSEDLRKVYSFLEEKDIIGHPRILALFDDYNVMGAIQSTKQKFLQTWKTLAANGTRVAIYGASRFTNWLEQTTIGWKQPQIVSVIDQRGRGAQAYFGMTPVSPDQFDPSTSDVILISSDVPSVIASMADSCLNYYGSDANILFIDSKGYSRQ